MGALEAAGRRLLGAGIGALLHAEQLGLDQLLRQRAAIDRHEGRVGAAAGLVQRPGEHLLADAGLAEQQHRDLAVGGLLQQFPGGAERRRDADQVARLQRLVDRIAQGAHLVLEFQQLVGHRVGAEIAHQRRRLFLGPLLQGPAHDPAAVGAALRFIEEHELAHDAADIAAGVANLHPAAGAGFDAEQFAMDVALEGVAPDHLDVAVAAGDVDVEAHRLHLDAAFQRVQQRPLEQDVLVRGVRVELADQLGVAAAGGEAHARQHAARPLHAQGGDQFLAEAAQGGAMEQDHALLAEPDVPRGEGELQLLGEFLDARRAVGGGLAGSLGHGHPRGRKLSS